MRRRGIRIRVALAAAVAATVLPLSACQQRGCSGVNLDYGQDAAGAPDARAALDAFLAGQQGHDYPSDGWVGPSSTGVFRSGSASVTVALYPGLQGWFAVSGQTC